MIARYEFNAQMEKGSNRKVYEDGAGRFRESVCVCRIDRQKDGQ